MNNKKAPHSFNIPDNYFKDLSEQIELNKLKSTNHFIAPTDYFNELEQSILEKTIPQKKSTMIQLNYWVAAACVLIFVVVSLPFILNRNESNSTMVDSSTENQVYEKIYEAYIVNEHQKKSSNVTLDDSDFVLYDY